jgi:hypothetical protein
MKWYITAVLIPALVLSTGGCAAHRPANLTPGQTAIYNVNQAVAVISTTNKSLTQTVIALADKGVLPKAQADAVLTWNRALAQAIITLENAGLKPDVPLAQRLEVIRATVLQVPLPPDVQALLQTKGPAADVAVVISGVQQLVVMLQDLAAHAKVTQ